jgi:hypothetical protein
MLARKKVEEIAAGKRDAVRDWMLDIPMPWPDKESDRSCSPLADPHRPPVYNRGRRTEAKRQAP